MYDCKTSYIDVASKTQCNISVDQAEPQDIGKTLGAYPVGQIGAAVHLLFNQTER